MIAVIIFLLLISLILGYITYNLLKKIEFYERSIEDFYSLVELTLRNMRLIDEKQMFETDDEVGDVFSRLVDILNTLRPLLYGIPEDDDKEKN